MAKCKWCGAEIIWVRTRKGKLMPVNSDPIKISPARDGKQTYISEAGDLFRGDEACEDMSIFFYGYVKGYEVHFGTCPNYKKRSKEQ